MTAYTDKFGRTWQHTPGHDTGQMLQIDVNLLYAVLRMQGIFAGVKWLEGAGDEPERPEDVDAYLLKGKEIWYVGIRYGDRPHEYLSPYVDPRLVEMLVESHSLLCKGSKEYAAVWELVTKPKLEKS